MELSKKAKFIIFVILLTIFVLGVAVYGPKFIQKLQIEFGLKGKIELIEECIPMPGCAITTDELDLYKHYKTLQKNKTAKLIAASLQMGAVIVGLDKKVQDALYDFGIDLGLLFQIQDDIIDETQSEEEAGKTTGNDSDKNSFVNLLGIETSVEEADTLEKDLQRRFERFDEKLQTALQPMMNTYLF